MEWRSDRIDMWFPLGGFRFVDLPKRIAWDEEAQKENWRLQRNSRHCISGNTLGYDYGDEVIHRNDMVILWGRRVKKI